MEAIHGTSGTTESVFQFIAFDTFRSAPYISLRFCNFSRLTACLAPPFRQDVTVILSLGRIRASKGILLA